MVPHTSRRRHRSNMYRDRLTSRCIHGSLLRMNLAFPHGINWSYNTRYVVSQSGYFVYMFSNVTIRECASKIIQCGPLMRKNIPMEEGTIIFLHAQQRRTHRELVSTSNTHKSNGKRKKPRETNNYGFACCLPTARS